MDKVRWMWEEWEERGSAVAYCPIWKGHLPPASTWECGTQFDISSNFLKEAKNPEIFMSGLLIFKYWLLVEFLKCRSVFCELTYLQFLECAILSCDSVCKLMLLLNNALSFLLPQNLAKLGSLRFQVSLSWPQDRQFSSCSPSSSTYYITLQCFVFLFPGFEQRHYLFFLQNYTLGS